jgi:hypothetical protein
MATSNDKSAKVPITTPPEEEQTTPPFPYWRVWRASSHLEEHGISSTTTKKTYHATTLQVVDILRTWGHKWAGQRSWQSVLNKPSLQHEVEESIVALYHLHEWLVLSSKKRKRSKEPIVVVDLCCGKGLFSMLLSYMVGSVWKDCGISSIVLLDKATSIDWNHVEAANETAAQEGRPELNLWKGVNLHDYDILLERLLALKTTLALVGIHLCKTLSPTAISLVNGLGRIICPYFLLAPCCLPRVVTSKYMKPEQRKIPIHQYEAPSVRLERRRAMKQRDQASGRSRRGVCYLCQKEGHRVRACPTLERKPEEERKTILKDAALQIPCWKCGKVGHFKADCPAADAPLLIEPPTRHWSVDAILAAPQPFVAYCQVLGESIKDDDDKYVVVLHETGLENTKTKGHDDSTQEGNWNQGRKSIYIVAHR